MTRLDDLHDAPLPKPGTGKGGEKAKDEKKEPDRDETGAGRPASDATGINPKDREPIDPEMPNMFRHLIVELAVLTFLIVALVISLVLLRKRGEAAVAERAT